MIQHCGRFLSIVHTVGQLFRWILFVVAYAAVSNALRASEITLLNSDALNASSFNTGLNWSNAQPPSASNTYKVDGAGVVLRTPAAGGNFTFAGSSLTLSGGGTLAFKGFSGNTITVNNLLLDNGYIGAFAGGGPTFTLAGNIILGPNGGGVDTGAANRGTNITAHITGNGGFAIYNGGTVYLSQTNAYSGVTTVNASVLQLNSTYAAQNSTVLLNGDHELAFGSGINTFYVGGLSGTGLIPLADVANHPVNIHVGGNGHDSEYQGDIAGSGGLTKEGSGTLTLSGASEYLGGTTVNGGTLAVNNSHDSATGAGPVALSAGTILTGAGSIIGAVTSTAATIAPGGSSGLSVGSTTLDHLSHLAFQLGASGSAANSLLQVHGNLTLAGTLDVTELTGFGVGVYPLIRYSGSFVDQGLSIGSLFTQFPGSYIDTSHPGEINLHVADVPEPTAILLALAGAIICYWPFRFGSHLLHLEPNPQ